MLQGDPETQDPVVYDSGVSYMFVQHNNVFLMAASRQNCNAASLLFFLHRVVDVSAIGNYRFMPERFITNAYIKCIDIYFHCYNELLDQGCSF